MPANTIRHVSVSETSVNQNGSYSMEQHLPNTDSITDTPYSAAQEIDAREQMISARREQQRIHLMRILSNRC